MKTVTIEMIDTRKTYLDVAISDELYESFKKGNYKLEDLDDLEDECVSKLDSCDFDDCNQDRDVGIVNITYFNESLLGKGKTKLEKEVEWVNKYLHMFDYEAKANSGYILLKDLEKNGDNTEIYDDAVEILKHYDDLILDNYNESKIQGWETLEDLENRLKELYEENNSCSPYTSEYCLDDLIIVRELEGIMED